MTTCNNLLLSPSVNHQIAKMKARFNTYDIVCIVTELQKLVGMRVNQIYDIDNRLIKSHLEISFLLNSL